MDHWCRRQGGDRKPEKDEVKMVKWLGQGKFIAQPFNNPKFLFHIGYSERIDEKSTMNRTKFYNIVFCLLAMFMATSPRLTAQNKQDDLTLLNDSKPQHDLRSWKQLYDNPQKKSPSFFQVINPFYWAFSGLLTGYQQVISPQMSANCIYDVSCSRFSRIAIKKYGIIKGIALTADRLSRCTSSTQQNTPGVFFTQKGKIRDLMLEDEHKH